MMIFLVKQLKERETRNSKIKIQFHIVMFAYITELEWGGFGSDVMGKA
jgi:hypothetical protein